MAEAAGGPGVGAAGGGAGACTGEQVLGVGAVGFTHACLLVGMTVARVSGMGNRRQERVSASSIRSSSRRRCGGGSRWAGRRVRRCGTRPTGWRRSWRAGSGRSRVVDDQLVDSFDHVRWERPGAAGWCGECFRRGAGRPPSQVGHELRVVQGFQQVCGGVGEAGIGGGVGSAGPGEVVEEYRAGQLAGAWECVGRG